MDEERTRSTLKRVAQALGVREEAIRENALHGCEPTLQARLEELELLKLFSTITDPKTRRSCLEYVRATAISADMAVG